MYRKYKRLSCVLEYMPVQKYFHNETVVVVFIMVVPDGGGFGVGRGDSGAHGGR